ncbi:MAG: ABC transporter permease [Clostridia bacterium]|nr:ABC transporter permease [Clostridia bacterium]
MNNKIPEISSEKFRFVNNGERITDVKLETKPVGYFKDALQRFGKNKASIVATVIISLIILYAFLVPLFTFSHDAQFRDNYYKMKEPRIDKIAKMKLGFLDGGRKDTLNERAFINMIALGVAAESNEANGYNVVSLGEALESELCPVIRLSDIKTQNKDNYYTTRFDSVLSVGFIYKQVTQDEYKQMLDWQNETGIQLIYPIIADNEFSFDATDANWWYKTSANGTPLKKTNNGQYTSRSYKEDLVLEDNYERDSEGNVKFFRFVGGGDASTASYQVRILYYSYYQYINGFAPNYLLGTDSSGYDLALRMASGIRLSLILAFSVSIINFIIGAMYGAVEGYYGGAVDIIMERISDILVEVPFIVVSTLFQIHLAKKVGAVPSLLFAFVLTGWIGTASGVRTQFYRFKNQEYVMAARTLGASDARIIWKHIFPNSLGTIITSSALVIPGVIFSESMLSFLGIVNLGGSKFTSLGQLLSDASSKWISYPHLMFYPALIISLLMICFNLFGNGLRDAFNPSLRGVDE